MLSAVLGAGASWAAVDPAAKPVTLVDETSTTTSVLASNYTRGEGVSLIGGGVQAQRLDYELRFIGRGRYTLSVEYAGLVIRPIWIYWDGNPLAYALKKTTGGWGVEGGTVCDEVATVEVAAGRHTLKLQEFYTMPTISKITLTRTSMPVSVPYLENRLGSLARALQQRSGELSSAPETVAGQMVRQQAVGLARDLSSWRQRDVTQTYQEMTSWETRLRAITEQTIRLEAAQRFGDNPDYLVGIEDSMTKVRRERTELIFTGAISREVAVSLAGNEYESRQLVILPAKPLHRVDITISALTDHRTNATIGRNNLVIKRVGYVKTKTPSYVADYVGWWPDPLFDFQPFDVPADEVQPLWITVHAPAGTPAGTYEGSIRVTCANAAETTLRLIATVRDFRLPKKQHLIHSNLLWPYAFNQFYGYGPKGPLGPEYDYAAEYRNLSPAAIDKLFAFALQYRIGFMNAGWGASQAAVPTWPITKTGSGYDYSEMDRRLRFCMDGGMSGVAMGDLHTPSFKQDEGYRKKIGELTANYSRHLKKHGWSLYMKLQDEPHVDQFGPVKEAGALVKRVAPSIERLCTTHLEYAKLDAGLADAIDIWCCGVLNYDPSVARELQARGKKVWWYNTGVPPYPNLFIDGPAVGTRILFWHNWKFKIDGYLNWGLNWWPEGNNKKPAAERWPKGPWDPMIASDVHMNGDGYTTYPGAEPGDLLSSIRLENLRDSAEDYEYFYLLQQTYGELSKINKGEYGTLIKEAQELLNIPDDIIKTTSDFTTDSDKLYGYREKVAILIEKISHILSNQGGARKND